MDAADNCTVNKPEADISIVERIVRKTGNRKLAAILALDLFLVGVDTVSVLNYLDFLIIDSHFMYMCVCLFFLSKDFRSSLIHHLSIGQKSR